MDWNILGIEETKDKAAITAAYREKLKTVNPEDSPEEFMALRESYEEALKLADEEEKPKEEDNSPLGLWKKELSDIYEDLGRRIDVSEWTRLMNEDICLALDTRADCEEAMLAFFMEHFHVPQKVWIYLDSEFSFIERKEELYEKYPKDFVDYVIINGIKLGERLPYSLFYPGKSGKDSDTYISLFNKASRTPWAEEGPVFDEMNKLSERHPYGDTMMIRCRMDTENIDLMDDLKAVSDKYPGDGYLIMEVAEAMYGKERWSECEEWCQKVSKDDPDYYHSLRLRSYSLAKQEKFEDAIKVLHIMMSEAGGDRKQLYELSELRKEWNQSLITKYEEELKERPDDDHLLFDLAWCYLQNDRNEDCLKLAEKIKEDSLDVFDYNNLMGQTYLSLSRPLDALPCIEKLIDYLKDLKPDGTEETDRRISRFQEMNARRAACLYEAGRVDEAISAYKEAEAIDPNDGETLTEITQIYMHKKDYESAYEYAKKLVAARPGSYHGYLLLAYCCFELRKDGDAFDAINRAISMDGSDLSSYILKLRILIRNGVYDEAHSLIDYLRENGVNDAAVLEACEAMLYEQEDGDQKEALKKYEAVVKKVEEQDQYIGFENEVYYRMASLTAAIADSENRVARKEILALLEKSLKYAPDDPDALDYKAWLLKKEGKLEESLEIYKGLEKLQRNNLDVERQIAEIYYSDLDFKAPQSLEYYQKLLADKETADYHFYVGMCYFYMDDYDNAIKHFLREQEMEPDVLDGYYRLSHVYLALGRNEEALKEAKKVIDIIKDKEEDQSRYYIHLARIYRRMRMPSEAIEAIRTALDKYGYAKANKDMFEIAIQFGLWQEAENILKRWKVNRDQAKDWSGKEAMFLALKGEKLRSKLYFADKAAVMNKDDLELMKMIFGSTDKAVKEELKIRKQRLSDALKNGWDLYQVYSNYAFSLLKAGETDKAKEMAANALTAIDKEQPPNHRYMALYESKKAADLAMTGRIEEAKLLLEKVRTMPLCENCNYPSCKDADIYAVEIAVAEGKYKQALEMSEDFLKKWPDETDFLILKNYLISKGLDK